MFTDKISLGDAQISGIVHKLKDGVLTSRILVSATLTEGIAEELECKGLVFTPNGIAKEGWSKLELSTGCASCRAVFQAAPELKQEFELDADAADNFVVERQAEGRLRLKLRLNYHGDPYKPLAYVLAVGSGESWLEITPLQKEIEDASGVDAKLVVTDKSGQQMSIPVPQETLRRAALSSRSASKKVN